MPQSSCPTGPQPCDLRPGNFDMQRKIYKGSGRLPPHSFHTSACRARKRPLRLVSTKLPNVKWRSGRDSNPRDGSPPTHFPGVRLRPLGHRSAGGFIETTLRDARAFPRSTRSHCLSWDLRYDGTVFDVLSGQPDATIVTPNASKPVDCGRPSSRPCRGVPRRSRRLLTHVFHHTAADPPARRRLQSGQGALARPLLAA